MSNKFNLSSISRESLESLSPYMGVCNGCYTATLSDSVDLRNPGWIQPRLLSGNIKVVDMENNIITLVFDLKEVSLFRIKRVFSTETTADMGIVVYY